jgi:hypothetical protein
MRAEVLKTWLNGVENKEKAQEKGEEGYEGATPGASSSSSSATSGMREKSRCRCYSQSLFSFLKTTLVITAALDHWR